MRIQCQCNKVSDVQHQWRNCPYCGGKYSDMNIDIELLLKQTNAANSYGLIGSLINIAVSALGTLMFMVYGFFYTSYKTEVIGVSGISLFALIFIAGFFVIAKLQRKKFPFLRV